MMATKKGYNARMPDRVIRMELISIYTQYPDLVGSAEELAQRLGRDTEQVLRQMEDLVLLRILDRMGEGENVRYCYLEPLSINPAISRSRAHYNNHRASGLPTGHDIEGEGGGKYGGETPKTDEEAGLRLQLMISTLKKQGWKECLQLLIDTIYHIEGTSCAAYLLGDRCSDLLWDYQCGTNGTKAGMTKIAGVQNMVVEGELIQEKGLLDTSHHIKYLYPLNEYEDVLICICRNGSYHVDIALLKSLFVDIMPVVADKRQQDLIAEKAAEKMLKDSIYWNTVNNPDIKMGLAGALASAAKSVEAGRASLLFNDGEGSLRTFSTYGALKHHDALGRVFPIGEGVAGWCVERHDIANLANPRVDPRFIGNDYDDIDSILCCPLVPCDGRILGAICAVNKNYSSACGKARFDERDVRLLESIAHALTQALIARDNHTKVLPRKFIQSLMTA